MLGLLAPGMGQALLCPDGRTKRAGGWGPGSENLSREKGSPDAPPSLSCWKEQPPDSEHSPCPGTGLPSYIVYLSHLQTCAVKTPSLLRLRPHSQRSRDLSPRLSDSLHAKSPLRRLVSEGTQYWGVLGEAVSKEAAPRL